MILIVRKLTPTGKNKHYHWFSKIKPSYSLRQKRCEYSILISCFTNHHLYDLHELSAWVDISVRITHASVQGLDYGKKVMRYGHILRSSLVKHLKKKFTRAVSLVFCKAETDISTVKDSKHSFGGENLRGNIPRCIFAFESELCASCRAEWAMFSIEKFVAPECSWRDIKLLVDFFIAPDFTAKLRILILNWNLVHRKAEWCHIFRILEKCSNLLRETPHQYSGYAALSNWKWSISEIQNMWQCWEKCKAYILLLKTLTYVLVLHSNALLSTNKKQSVRFCLIHASNQFFLSSYFGHMTNTFFFAE